jgi:hypothetical protein
VCQYKGVPVQCGPRGLKGSTGILYHNKGDGTCEEVGLHDASYPYVVFGGKFVDYDNDGLLDIFAVSGHTQDDIDQYKPGITYPEPKLLFRNVGGRFRRVEDGPGGVLARLKVSRGAGPEAKLLLTFMFILFILGLASVALAPVVAF